MFEKTFKALSDPARREILKLLRTERMSAGEIADHFQMTNATIFYHLSILKDADLVYEEKEKNFVYYNLNISVFEQLMLYLKSFLGEDHEK